MSKVHKDKAKDIYFSMLNAGRGITSSHLAGESAKIAVQQLVDEFDCMVTIYGSKFKTYLTYWKRVLKELKKLCHDKS